MKKLLLLLLLSVLMVESGKDIYATSTSGIGKPFYNCTCQGLGTDYTYYKCPERIYYNCILIHEFDTSGNVIDRHFSYPKCSPEDLCYWVVRVQVGADGTKTIVPSRIIISEDPNITLYDNHNGTTKTLTYSEYSGRDKGNYNGKYYFLDSSYIFMTINESTDNGYEILWSGDWHYIVESEDSYNDIVDLAIYLCGGDVDIPDNVTAVTPLPAYDLEAPLGVTVSSSDYSRNFQIYGDGLYQGSNLVIPYKVWWNQSNIDLTGYETEFYVREYGKYKKSLFSSWVDVITPYLFDKSFVTAKYCNNSLKYYEFSPKDKKRIYTYCQDVAGKEPYAVEFYHPDFMLRNKKEDENGQMHYSNWVYVKTYEDGTYSVFEMNKDYSLNEDSDETGQINTDSTIYDDELVYEDTEETLDVGGVSNVGSFIKVMKDLANSLKTFPEFFAKMFSFLPSWVLTCIGILFIIILICAIF